MGSLPGSKTQGPSEHMHLPRHHSISTFLILMFPFPLSKYCFLFTLAPCYSFCHHHFIMSRSQSKTMEKTQKSFSASSFGLSVPILIISTLTLFSFTHGISLRFRDPAGLGSCQEPFSKVSLTGSTSLKRVHSLTHLLSNINPSVITVGNSSLLSACGSCSAQNHTFLRIWKIAASCLQLFSFLRAALSKRLPPVHGHPLSLLEWSTAQRAERVPFTHPSQAGALASTAVQSLAAGSTPAPELAAPWESRCVSPRTSLHPRPHPLELQAVLAGIASPYRYSLVSLKCKQTQAIPVFTALVTWAKYCYSEDSNLQHFHIWSPVRELKKKKNQFSHKRWYPAAQAREFIIYIKQ